ncbi:MAG TPA: Uma2 family endonuclease [Ktedonosporobacter sp.]|nr:Uma2 family endonuclease [Ktedonosporobacter sp.]
MATSFSHGQPPRREAMSEEEFHVLEQAFPDLRYEYIDGIAYLMAGGTRAHNQITRNIANAIERHLVSGPCFVCTESVQTLVGTKKSGKKHYMYPDVVISCSTRDSRRNNTLIEEPRIVVEVLSPSTEPKDKGDKLKVYKGCPTIEEIVPVNQFAKEVTVYRRAGDLWSYSLYPAETETVSFASIGYDLRFDDIYRGINFEEPLED